MAKVRPFRAIRPNRNKVHLFASRSYLTYSEETLKEKLDNNPFTYLHIINPEYNKEKKAQGISKYKLVKQKMQNFIDDGILTMDEKPSFYLYQQKKENHLFHGIIVAIAVSDYNEGIIKKHEQTLTKRQQVFKDFLATTQFNADPVLLTYQCPNAIKEIIEKTIQNRAEYDFTTTDLVDHKLWIISSVKECKTIEKEMKEIDSIYIADGHHRSASSALLAKESSNPESQYFMSILVDEHQLNVINFNRLIKSLNGISKKDFLERISHQYTISEIGDTPKNPIKKREITMYFQQQCYSLLAKEDSFCNVSASLDPSILFKHILKPILNILDEKTSQNITFVDGTISLNTIKQQVDNQEYAVAFILSPISIEAIKEVADHNEYLPPKSTYIEPKLRSGLTIYSLNQ